MSTLSAERGRRTYLPPALRSQQLLALPSDRSDSFNMTLPSRHRALGAVLCCALPQLQSAVGVAGHFFRTERPLEPTDIADSHAKALTVGVDSAGHLLKSAEQIAAEACTKLTNAGSYFTATIKVGTDPGKNFEVVADTGSNSVIVASCICSTAGSCAAGDNCFADTDSKSLHVNKSVDNKVPVVTMGFGSGTIEAEIGSDKVRIGSIEATMTDQLLLMIDKALDLKGKFEGILGLGIPEDPAGTSWTGQDHGVTSKDQGVKYITKSFLQEASLTRFSMCFQDTGQAMDGSLRIDIPQLSKPLGSVGTKHWGLAFHGISVGQESAATAFCKDSDITDPNVQKSPCGAIPDSGTTLILGPQEQLVTLYQEICDGWPRCKQQWDSNPTVSQGMQKEQLVEAMLANCSSWLNDSGNGLDELPDLHFKVTGSEGTAQTITFKGSQYIESGELDNPAAASSFASRKTLGNENFMDFINRRMPKEQRREGQYVCLAALGAVDYKTTTNGPVWILGTPLFYGFEVSFETASTPPSIQIADVPCNTCAAQMLEAPKELVKEKRSPKQPRRIGHARTSGIKLEGPF